MVPKPKIAKGHMPMHNKESTWLFSNEKGTSRFDETNEDMSTTINGTTTHIEASILSDEQSPRQNLNFVYQKLSK
jgi:hypothetical protein